MAVCPIEPGSVLKTIAACLDPRRKGAIANRRTRIPGLVWYGFWRGEMHEVTCREGLYFNRGQEYRSLSKVAKAITGTHWSGPAFFGTKAVNK